MFESRKRVYEVNDDDVKVKFHPAGEEVSSSMGEGEVAVASPEGADSRGVRLELRSSLSKTGSGVPALYEPPNREKAVKFMRKHQPRDPTNLDKDGNPCSYPIFTDDTKMATLFGDGISFWFVLLRYYVAVFIGITVLCSFFWNTARENNENNGTSSYALSVFARASLGAMLHYGHDRAKANAVTDVDRDNALAIVVFDAIIMFIISFMIVYMYTQKRRYKEKNDQSTITLDDYTVKVYGLPEDTTEEKVREHFARHGELHDVTFGRKTQRLIKLRRSMLDLEARRDYLEFILERACVLLGEMSARTEIDSATEGNLSAQRGLGDKVGDPRNKWVHSVRALHSSRGSDAASKFFSLTEDLLARARDKSKSNKERAKAAAQAAQQMDARKDVKAKKSGMKRQKPVGVLSVFSPKDFDIDDIERRLETNEQEINEKQAEIEECASDLPIVCAFVTYAEETGRYECINAVKDSIANETTRRKEGDKDWDRLAADDTRNFAGAHRLDILLTAAPSDVLWENLDFPRETLWKRRLLMNILMIVFLFLQMAAIARSRFAIQDLTNPKPNCDSIGEGGEYLRCPKIWDLDSSSVTNDQARVDIMHFVSTDVSAVSCDNYIINGEFVGNMTAYDGFADGNSLAYPSAADVESFRSAAQAGKDSGLYHGGFLTGTNVDECAAHLCYACYCEAKGHRAVRFDEDGLQEFCEEYWFMKLSRDTLMAIAVLVSASMNILIKVLSRVFSQLERHHSFTDQEKAVSNKLTAALAVNMVLLTLALSADVSSLSGIPFLFKGSFADMTRHWYEEFANRFCQVALLNAIMFPISCANPILKWRGTLFLREKFVNTQRQLNQLYIPPEYLLSERSGLFAGALVYTFIFGSGMPLLYVFMMFMCVAFYIIDRVMLFHLCRKPPRYTGKLSSLLIHVMPAGVLLHFTIAVWIFGERDFPSYVLSGGKSGKWDSGEFNVDGQSDVLARLMRVNGLVPFVCLILSAALFIVAYSVWGLRIYQQRKRGGVNEEMEGCPPVKVAIERMLVMGLTSYHISSNPDYRALFPPGDPVTRGV